MIELLVCLVFELRLKQEKKLMLQKIPLNRGEKTLMNTIGVRRVRSVLSI